MRTIVPILVAIFFFACDKNQELISSAEKGMEQTSVSVKLPDTNLHDQGNSQLIKTANYQFRVNDMKNSTAAIERITLKYPAFVSSSNLDIRNGRMENQIVVRVRNEFFDDVLKEIDKEAVFVHYRNVSTQDASKDFVDLESRLNTKREVEARYIEILRKKAGTIKELL